MANFIRLHNQRNNEAILVNLDNVLQIAPLEKGGCFIEFNLLDCWLKVTEDFDAVVEKLVNND